MLFYTYTDVYICVRTCCVKCVCAYMHKSTCTNAFVTHVSAVHNSIPQTSSVSNTRRPCKGGLLTRRLAQPCLSTLRLRGRGVPCCHCLVNPTLGPSVSISWCPLRPASQACTKLGKWLRAFPQVCCPACLRCESEPFGGRCIAVRPSCLSCIRLAFSERLERRFARRFFLGAALAPHSD